MTVTSLLSLLFMTFHMTHDVIRQAEGSVLYPIRVVIFALALSTTGWVTMILSARGLWTKFRSRRVAQRAATPGV